MKDTEYLQVISTSDLVDELHRRHESSVVITDKPARACIEDEDIEVRASGGHARSIGLLILGLVSIVAHSEEMD